jgi:hypothetical protein
MEGFMEVGGRAGKREERKGRKGRLKGEGGRGKVEGGAKVAGRQSLGSGTDHEVFECG